MLNNTMDLNYNPLENVTRAITMSRHYLNSDQVYLNHYCESLLGDSATLTSEVVNYVQDWTKTLTIDTYSILRVYCTHKGVVYFLTVKTLRGSSSIYTNASISSKTHESRSVTIPMNSLNETKSNSYGISQACDKYIDEFLDIMFLPEKEFNERFNYMLARSVF